MCLLLARFGVQKKLLQNSEKFSRFERLFSGTTAYSIYAASLALFFLFVFLFTIFEESFYSFETKQYYECTNTDMVYKMIGLVSIYSIFYSVMIIALYVAKVSEKLGMGTELKFMAVAGFGMGCTAGAFLYLVKDPGTLENTVTHSELKGFLFLLNFASSLVINFTINVTLPMYWSYRLQVRDSTSASKFSTSEETSWLDEKKNEISAKFETEEELEDFKRFLASEFSLENYLVCLHF